MEFQTIFHAGFGMERNGSHRRNLWCKQIRPQFFVSNVVEDLKEGKEGTSRNYVNAYIGR